MKRTHLIIALAVVIIGTGAGVLWYNFRGALPAVLPRPAKVEDLIPVGTPTPATPTANTTGIPLKLPAGFSISIFAKDLGGARVMSFAPDGSLFVTATVQGKVLSLRDRDGDGLAEDKRTVLTNLNKPHGLAWRCRDEGCTLYVTETNRVASYRYDQASGKATFDKEILQLPSGGGHFTRTIMFMPSPQEDELLVSVGSSCNVCNEQDSRRASVLAIHYDGSNVRSFARGLRNSVFMAIHPVTGAIWATEMGRDSLGDNIPPDEINILRESGNYGWPICYGSNVHDSVFDKNTYIRNPCMEPFETPSYLNLQAHSAPLGLAFIPEEGWPEDMWHNLLVSYHGSWNRTVPTGYKLVRFKLDAQGKPLGEPEDFITGWLTKNGALGRPVDILTQPGGTIYISDDKAGVIYRVKYQPTKN
jgi:glucose/arabinose dehydrogenase